MNFNRRLAANLIIVFTLFCVSAVIRINATPQLDIAGPAGTVEFGKKVVTLPSGNIVVTASLTDAPDNKAVYLYDGATGALKSTLTGNHVGERIDVLPSGNFLVLSPLWTNGNPSELGAITWCSGTVGCSGVVSPANSLVGATTYEAIYGYYSMRILPSGNYIVLSPNWDNGAATDAGAATWCSGTSGCSGVISAANSLVGTQAGDKVGWGLTILSNGNYVVASYEWKNGNADNAGAVTWGDGLNGTFGVVSTGNSLVGTKANDYVGYPGVTALTNGNYVISNCPWSNGSASGAGSVTWANGLGGTVGEVSPANSLVGTQAQDHVCHVRALTNGNYVMATNEWSNGAFANAGAVTWGNGSGGTVGAVSPDNSIVGSHPNDNIGGDVVPLANGNFVVRSSLWDDGTISDVGAITWGNGLGGTVGEVSFANSLVGTKTGDFMNGRIFPLTNGNYVVETKIWTFGSVSRGFTWGDGTSGVTGKVTRRNSLVTKPSHDPQNLVPLPNGHYVVITHYFDSGSSSYRGFITWVNGFGISFGTVDANNSLVVNDVIDTYIHPLPNGNYVVISPRTDVNGVDHAGAVTWCSGTGGTVGEMSAANSLVGTQANDSVGSWGITNLSNGNYVVRTGFWHNGSADAGAVTWANGLGGTVGEVSAANSLIGTQSEFPSIYVMPLSNGNYVVRTQSRNIGANTRAGAITWGNGSSGTIGVVSAENSLVGTHPNDLLGDGGITALSNGGYFVLSSKWDNNTAVDAGAVTYNRGAGVFAGTITAGNSVRGAASGGGGTINSSFDAVNETLVVGRPADNIVSIFRLVFNVSVSGAASTANGAPIRNVAVVLTDSKGVFRIEHTGSLGQYNFAGVRANETYTVSVSSKRHSFPQPTQVITPDDDLTNVNFVAEP